MEIAKKHLKSWWLINYWQIIDQTLTSLKVYYWLVKVFVPHSFEEPLLVNCANNRWIITEMVKCEETFNYLCIYLNIILFRLTWKNAPKAKIGQAGVVRYRGPKLSLPWAVGKGSGQKWMINGVMMPFGRIWAPFHTKVPIIKKYQNHMEYLSVSLHYNIMLEMIKSAN